MVINKNQVEREYQNFAPGSRPWNLTVDMLHSGLASDGGQGSQGARNQLVGYLLKEGVIDGIVPTSTIANRVDISQGLIIVKDTVINEYVIKTYAGGYVDSLLSGDFVFLTCAAGVVSLNHGLVAPMGSVRIVVFQTGMAFADIRNTGFILNPSGNNILAMPEALTLCGPNSGQKFRVLKADGTEIFNINTITGIVSAISSEEHAINADRLNGANDFNDFNSLPAPNPATDYVPIADIGKTVQPNLNSDQLDGYDAGHSSGQIPVADGVVNAELNADKLDGYHIGAGGVPIRDGNVMGSLNADMVDGAHVGDAGIPLRNGVVMSNLNADQVDGYHHNQGLQTFNSPTFVNVLTSTNTLLQLVASGTITNAYGTGSVYVERPPPWVIEFSGYLDSDLDDYGRLLFRANGYSGSLDYTTFHHWEGPGDSNSRFVTCSGVIVGESIFSNLGGNTFVVLKIHVGQMYGSSHRVFMFEWSAYKADWGLGVKLYRYTGTGVLYYGETLTNIELVMEYAGSHSTVLAGPYKVYALK